MTQLTLEHIAGSLFSHWADQFPLAATTIYPGTRVDTSALSEWLELSIETISPQPGRDLDPQAVELTVLMHVFVKPGLDKSRVWELADAARGTLADQTVTLHDYDTSGDPVIGEAIMQEARIRDATRTEADIGWHAMQHVVVRVAGTARAV